MKTIVLSPTSGSLNEPYQVAQLFSHGLDVFHLRKPRFGATDFRNYLRVIPENYHSRIVIHSNYMLASKYGMMGIHLTRRQQRKKLKTWLTLKYLKAKMPGLAVTASFHSLESLLECRQNYDHVFLSPVFDSISKKKHSSKFNDANLGVVLNQTKQNVIALGGVDIDKVEQIRGMGFAGLGLLGAIWESESPVASFIKIQQACQNNDL